MDSDLRVTKKGMVDGRPHYEIIFSKENLNFLRAGCVEQDHLVGRTDKFTFYLFNRMYGGVSDSFKLMPGGDGYFAYIGMPVERSLPQGYTGEDFEELATKFDGDMVDVINNSGMIPFTTESGIEGTGEIPLGYVSMRTE